jgi:hypothetical protein
MPRPPGYISLPTPEEMAAQMRRQKDIGGVIQSPWRDKYPNLYEAAKMGDEMIGYLPMKRFMGGLGELDSAVLRPDGAMEWLDWGAGMLGQAGQAALGAVDVAGAAPLVAKGTQAGVKAFNASLPGAGKFHLNPQGQLVPMEQAGVLRPSMVAGAREKGLLDPTAEKVAKGIEAFGEIDKRVKTALMGTKQQRKHLGEAAASLPRLNAHVFDRMLKENPNLVNQVREAEKMTGVKVLNDDGSFQMTPMESLLKGDTEFKNTPWAKELQPGQEDQPVYAGFLRSFTQKYVDNLPTPEFEALRRGVIKSVEQDFAAGKAANKRLEWISGEGGKFQKKADKFLGLRTSTRGAHKTGAAMNLSSDCPMFMIGGHGCYLDQCYVSSIGKAAGGTNMYTNAMYAGELLQASDDAIKAMNAAGGLRMNGMGDLTMAQLPQVRDAFKHAAQRGLKLKVISKQDHTWEIIHTLQKQKADPKAGITAKDAALVRKKAKEIVLQPTVDPYWIPVKMDDLPGSGARAHGIPQTQAKVDAGQVHPDALQGAVNVYKDMGLDAKIIDGQVYRKYGYSWDQIQALKERFPGVKIQPRVVVSSPREIAEYALNMPDALQTWMHAPLPEGMISDLDPDLAKTMLNFDQNIIIRKGDDGKWVIKAQSNTVKGAKAAGTLKENELGQKYFAEGITEGNKRAFNTVTEYIYDNYAPRQVDRIFKALSGQLKKDGSSLCCSASATVNQCFDCISRCHNGRHVTNAKVGQMAKEYENLLPMAK